MTAKWGSFSITATGDKVVTGVGFTPNVVMIFSNLSSAVNVDETYMMQCLGAATGTGGSEQGGFSAHGWSTGNLAGQRVGNNDIIEASFSSSTIVEADLKTFDSDGFTLNVTTLDTTRSFFYLALQVDDAYATSFTTRTTTGSQSITGVGFQPDGVIFFGTGGASVNINGTTSGTHFFGAAAGTGATQEFCHSGWNIAGGSAQTGRYHDDASCIVMTYEGLVPYVDANLTSLDADGVTLNFSVANASARYVIALFIKGDFHVTNSYNHATSTGNQSVTDIAFEPEAVIISSADVTALNTNTADYRWSIGGSDGAGQGNSWAGTRDNVNPHVTLSRMDNDAVILTKTNTGTLDSEASLSSLNSDGFTINWSTAKAGPIKGAYVAIGAAAAAGGTINKLRGLLGGAGLIRKVA